MESHEKHLKIAGAIYLFIMGCLLISLIVNSIWLIITLRAYQHDDWNTHKSMIYRYTFFMLASLIIKIILVLQLTDYDNNSNLVLYTISDLLALTLFSIFKIDEDCFSCFNRC